MKKEISYKTIIAMIIFAISTMILVGLAFSTVCLSWFGTAFLIADVIIAGYSFLYLDKRYERLNRKGW